MSAANIRAGRGSVLRKAESLLSGHIGESRREMGAPPVPGKEDTSNPDRTGSPSSDGALSLHFVRASDVRPEPVTWLWEGYLPAGKLTIWEARMGVGKTTTATALMAAVSTGGPLPGQELTPQGHCAIVSSEDDASDTLVPRLMAASADRDRCHIFSGFAKSDGTVESGAFNLEEHLARLRSAILRHELTLIILDPVTAMLGSVNSYKDSEVRGLLAPLAAIAAETGCAIVMIRHLKKGGGAAEDQGSGSIGLGAASRMVVRLDRDPESEGAYLLSVVKASLAERAPTLRYRIVGEVLPGDIRTARVEWCGTSTLTAHDLAELSSGSIEDLTDRSRAAELLRELLAAGPQKRTLLMQAASKEGISERTMQREAKRLGVIQRRDGFRGSGEWSLPAVATSAAQSRPVATSPQNVATGDLMSRLGPALEERV